MSLGVRSPLHTLRRAGSPIASTQARLAPTAGSWRMDGRVARDTPSRLSSGYRSIDEPREQVKQIMHVERFDENAASPRLQVHRVIPEGR